MQSYPRFLVEFFRFSRQMTGQYLKSAIINTLHICLVHKSRTLISTSTTGPGFNSIPQIINKTAKTMELSTVNPKQSPVILLASPCLGMPYHKDLQPRYPLLPGSPPGTHCLLLLRSSPQTCMNSTTLQTGRNNPTKIFLHANPQVDYKTL
jgi:hypothetical protein